MVSRALLPTLFLSHGGGPGFFMKVPKSSPFADISQDSAARHALFDVGKNPESYGLPANPSAIVVVSAHWEESSGFHVYSVEKPSLIYDYYGFPPHTYELKYDAPGSPSLANRIVDMINADPMLNKSRRAAVIDEQRGGFDHGVFLPLMLLYPSATIPIVQVSLNSKLNLAEHVQLGRVLSPLRQENVLIIGSGSATHPMAPGGSPEKTEEFMKLLESIIVNPSLSNEERLKALPNIWNSKLMSATHIPTAEHLMPLFVVAGAAQGGAGTELFKRGKDFRFMNGLFSMACYLFSPSSAPLEEEQKC